MIVIENGTINININIVFKQDCPELFLEILYIMFYNSSHHVLQLFRKATSSTVNLGVSTTLS